MSTAVLLLLADGRFPGGGSAHSGGLEAAVAAGVVADLDGDGADEIIAGWRDTVPGKSPPGINIYKANDGATAWQKHPLERGGVATEDLACADLNGDGRTDIVAVGRATGNVKIYWNEGASAAKAD